MVKEAQRLLVALMETKQLLLLVPQPMLPRLVVWMLLSKQQLKELRFRLLIQIKKSVIRERQIPTVLIGILSYLLKKEAPRVLRISKWIMLQDSILWALVVLYKKGWIFQRVLTFSNTEIRNLISGSSKKNSLDNRFLKTRQSFILILQSILV